MALVGAVLLRRASRGLAPAPSRALKTRFAGLWTRLSAAQAGRDRDPPGRGRSPSGSAPDRRRLALRPGDPRPLPVAASASRSLALVVVAIAAIYIVVNFSDNVDDIQKFKVPLSVVVSYYFFLLPQVLHDILPMTFVIAFLGTAAVLERNNETTALKAAGISLTRSALPLLLLGARARGRALRARRVGRAAREPGEPAARRRDPGPQGGPFVPGHRSTRHVPARRPHAGQLPALRRRHEHPRPPLASTCSTTGSTCGALHGEQGDLRRAASGIAENGWYRTFMAGGSADFSPNLTELPIAVEPTVLRPRVPQAFADELRPPPRLHRHAAGGRLSGRSIRVQLHQKLTYPLSLVRPRLARAAVRVPDAPARHHDGHRCRAGLGHGLHRPHGVRRQARRVGLLSPVVGGVGAAP